MHSTHQKTEFTRPPSAPQDLVARFARMRAGPTVPAEPLTAENQVVQSTADASPTKWHLAHEPGESRAGAAGPQR